jgi:hypothetical protein
LVFSALGIISCGLAFLGVIFLKEGTIRTAIPIEDYEFPEIWTWGKVYFIYIKICFVFRNFFLFFIHIRISLLLVASLLYCMDFFV